MPQPKLLWSHTFRQTAALRPSKETRGWAGLVLGVPKSANGARERGVDTWGKVIDVRLFGGGTGTGLETEAAGAGERRGDDGEATKARRRRGGAQKNTPRKEECFSLCANRD